MSNVPWSVCMCVLDTSMSPAKAAEPIEIPFGGRDSCGNKKRCLKLGLHWRLLANTIERSVRNGNAALLVTRLMFCCCFKKYFSDFYQTDYLNIYRTDLHEICRIGRTFAVVERSEVIFSISQGTLSQQSILWAKSTSNLHIAVRVTFARAAPPAYDKKGNCYAGRRQTNYLFPWTKANQLSNKLTIINKRLEG